MMQWRVHDAVEGSCDGVEGSCDGIMSDTC